MAKVSERVNVMKKNFMTLHEQGYSIPEIAQKFNLSFCTVYRLLDEIAKENNLIREDLLQILRTPSEEQLLRREHKKVHVDVQAMQKEFKMIDEILENLIGQIDNVLEENI